MTRRPLFIGVCAIAMLALFVRPTLAQAGSGGGKGASSDDVAALKKLVQDQAEQIRRLTERIDRLEKFNGQGAPAPGQPAAPDTAPGEPPIPPIEIPGEDTGTPGPANTTPSAGPTAGSTKASLMPDLSVIGNNIGRFFSVHGDPERNRLQLGEFEIGLQQPILTGVRFDGFLTADAGDNFQVAVEEAYATFSTLGHLPFGAYLGQKRLDFGKINSIHPHARSYADQPAVLSNLMGPDGLTGNGAALTYLLPIKNLFANVELGMWKVDSAPQGINVGPAPTTFYPAGLGVSGNFPLGRLWLSKDLGKAGELELGGSGGFGRADNGDDINLAGLDFTYRFFPSTFQRWMAQGEVFWHTRKDQQFGTGSHTRSGEYLLLSYRPDQYYEYGLRYDNSKYPWPLPGRDESYSLIWSNRLTEVTLLRLQLKHGYRSSDVFLPASRNYNEIWLQFIWGAGSHTHPLQ